MIPNTEYSAGLSRMSCNYYTNYSKAKAYFSRCKSYYYNLYNLKIYFNFHIKIIYKIDKVTYHIDMIDDSYESIIYKI